MIFVYFLIILNVFQNKEIYPGNEFKGECRGEIVVLKNDYIQIKDKLLRKDGSSYKNERQAVSGLLN